MIIKIYYHQGEATEYSRRLNEELACIGIARDRLLEGLVFLVPFSEECFQYVYTIEEADVVPMLLGHEHEHEHVLEFMSKYLRADQILIDLNHIMHVSENISHIYYLHQQAEQLQKLTQEIPIESRPRVFLAHTNSTEGIAETPDNLIYTDFLWNRQKTFYVTQPDSIFNADPDIISNHWYPNLTTDGLNKKIYELSDLDWSIDPDRWKGVIWSPHNVPRLFLSPNKIREISRVLQQYSGYLPTDRDATIDDAEFGVRDWLRSSLIEKLQCYPGFIGNPTSGNILVGQGSDEESLKNQICNSAPLGWQPINNSYYDNSAISIYVETLTYTEVINMENFVDGVRCVTEKTWEPIIKGHMILPFGYAGFLRDLEEQYGILLPDEIDYSYDNIQNDLNRWVCYLDTVGALLNKGPDHLFKIKRDNLDKIKHNRSLFFNSGYRSSLGEQLLNICSKDRD